MADTATAQTKPLRAAIVYDFDGTLARGPNLQERSFIPIWAWTMTRSGWR